MDYSFINDELKKKIETTKFVFLVARASTGKTFSGDYLECIRGWKHVDGDIPCKNMMKNPEWKTATERMFGWGEFEGKTCITDGKLENQKPYFESVARLTLEAARDSNKVVVSHATYPLMVRVYFRQLLVDAGAKDVSTVFLYCDPDNHAKALWDRLNRQSEDSGIPLSDLLKTSPETLGADGINGFESFRIWFREESATYTMFEEAAGADQPYRIVNNTAKDATVLDRLDEVFGIAKNTSRGNETYDKMIQRIKAIDAERDMEMYEAYDNIMKNDMSEDAKAKLEMAKSEFKNLPARPSILLDEQEEECIRRLSHIHICV